MKKLIIVLLIGLLVLAGIVLVRTLNFSPRQFAGDIKAVSVPADPEKLSKGIRFQTISHKAEMLDEKAFAGFHDFLKTEFPLMDSLLQKQKFSKYSLMFTWRGSEQSLEPLVIMAHQDVVPVEYASLEDWDYPPFSGAVTDSFIYGRGTIDDKGSLIAICEAVEHLLRENFTPRRSIYLCFGHDEEIGGEEGAKLMAEELHRQGVRAWMVLDEGGTLATGLVPGIDKTVALIGTSEKGYVSLEFFVELPGGHSSMPEEKTALEVLNTALYRLHENPLPNRISPPMEGFIRHIGPHLPFGQKLAFANPWLFKPLIFSAYKESASGAAMIHTTQVPTIFSSGIKDNIVPGRAKAVVNYRLLPGDTPEGILARARKIVDDTLVRIAMHENIAIPASPVSDYNSRQFEMLASSIKAVNDDVLVSPYLVLGATDSRHFYLVSEHVFRFSPIALIKSDLPRIHGLNERITRESYSKSVNFYATLISNN